MLCCGEGRVHYADCNEATHDDRYEFKGANERIVCPWRFCNMTGFSCSRDGTQAIGIWLGEEVVVYDIATGAEVTKGTLPTDMFNSRGVVVACNMLASVTKKGVFVFDAITRAKVFELQTADVTGIVLDDYGDRIAVQEKGSTNVLLYDVHTGVLFKSLTMDTQVYDVQTGTKRNLLVRCWSKNRIVASVAETWAVFDIESGVNLGMNSEANGASCFAFDEAMTRLAVASRWETGSTIRIFDMANERSSAKTFTCCSSCNICGPIHNLDFHPAGVVLAAGTRDAAHFFDSTNLEGGAVGHTQDYTNPGFCKVKFLPVSSDSIAEAAAVVLLEQCNGSNLSGDVRRQFVTYDSNGDGTISADELGAVLKSLNPHLTDQKVATIFSVVDVSKDGKIDYDEFCKWLFPN